MPSWPVQGDNAGTWGTDLNACLLVSMNSDGTLKLAGSGATAGYVLLANASGTGGAQTDSHLSWTGGSGATFLNVGAASGQTADIVLDNAATTEWYIYNLGSNNTFHIDSATLGALAFSQAGALTLPQYGAGFLQTSSTGLVSAGSSIGANSSTIALASDASLTAGAANLVLDSGALAAGTYYYNGQLAYIKGATTTHVEILITHNGGTSWDGTVDENGTAGGAWDTLSVAAVATLTASQHLSMYSIPITAGITAKSANSGGNPPATTLTWVQIA